MNRFVILLHKLNDGTKNDFGNEHWDVMLEVEIKGNSQLDTWSISPPLNSIKSTSMSKTTSTSTSTSKSKLTKSDNIDCVLNSFSCKAKRLPYHRLEYLDYEGEVSRNRGYVERIDKGIYEKINDNKFRLFGNLFNGELTISNNSKESDYCEMSFEKYKIENEFTNRTINAVKMKT
ncbi:MAG: hypothetical protein LBE18_05480 [Planctomycetaceae bacterium]|jgi:hypothetical protein|nr:hypothetical protein [Planctomycetaceae bacterium]